jgi:hypothetical protein
MDRNGQSANYRPARLRRNSVLVPVDMIGVLKMRRSTSTVLFLGLTIAVGVAIAPSLTRTTAQNPSAETCPTPIESTIASPNATVSPATQPQLLSPDISSTHEDGDTVLSGEWSLPHNAFITFQDGDRALVTVESGDITLLVCEAEGIIDTEPFDGQTTTAAEGDTMAFTTNDQVYFFLDEGHASFRIYGATQENSATVGIELLRWNTAPSVCTISDCWEAETVQPDNTVCKDLFDCTGPGTIIACAGIRCWFP